MPEYIEREAAVAKLNLNKNNFDTKSDAEYAEMLLFGVPAADVEVVRHGEWRFVGADRWNDTYECSVCWKMAMDDSAYCPNCGAKMDGKGEGE